MTTSPPLTIAPSARSACSTKLRTSAPNRLLRGSRELALDLVHLDRLLRKDGSRALFAVGCDVPLAMEDIALGLQLRLVEERELVVAPAQDEPLHDRLEHGVRVHGTGTEIPRESRNRPVLPEEDVEDDPVDAVVAPEVGQDADGLARLVVAVDAPLALLVAGRVPREVVVNDRVELLLEVDALAQTVGRNEDAFGSFAEGEHALLALGGGSSPSLLRLDASELGRSASAR